MTEHRIEMHHLHQPAFVIRFPVMEAMTISALSARF
jgi:hypothetical protein